MQDVAQHRLGEVFALSKRRLKFSKTGMGKYISHLDLLRTFTRAIHRANLPVRYSQGFNPHQLITFSLPLPIGVTSETEFVDIDFEESATNSEIMEKLNLNLPPDIKILSVGLPEIKASNIVAAEYIFEATKENISVEKIEKFFAQEQIDAVKKTKKGEKEVNLKEFIRGFNFITCENDKTVMDIVLSAGGEANIKPEIVLLKLQEYMGHEFDSYSFHRIKIFYKDRENIEIFC